MSQPKVKIITTEDGSHSLYHEELQETYHSSHGAFRESIHVFMLYGLDSWLARNPKKFPIRVFELGFGTGLNAWLALVWAEQNQVPVLYHSIEPFPLEAAISNQPNYTFLLNTSDAPDDLNSSSRVHSIVRMTEHYTI